MSLFILLYAGTARASCPEAGIFTQTAERSAKLWLQKQPLRDLPANLSLADAACVRQHFVARLQPELGRIAGYKAALTNRTIQQKFGATVPIRGVLLARMLTMESAFPVAINFGTRPVIEADLLVEVGDEAINDARTPQEALQSLSKIFPFIELADLAVGEGEPLNAAVITAINAGARGGIFGQSVAVQPTQQFADALRTMRVVMTDDSGKELANNTGAAILDHPLNAVLWLVEDLRKNNIRLRVRDRLSLGSFSPLIVPRPEMRVSVRYIGLPGDPQIHVRFK